MPQRFYIVHSETEWSCVEKQAEENGFSCLENYIHHLLRREGGKLPVIQSDTPDKKIMRSFTIHDDSLLSSIQSYCKYHTIKPSSLMRRIITDPVIRRCMKP